MSASKALPSIHLRQFAEQFRSDMIPLTRNISYFTAAVPLSAEDLRDYIDEPFAALPPSIAAALPKILIILVPYLAKAPAAPRSRRGQNCLISMEPPAEGEAAPVCRATAGKEVVLAFAVTDVEVADYHYRLYRAIAEVFAGLPAGVPKPYLDLLREELDQRAHGEVDEASWSLKQSLHGSARRFPLYATQSFIDTLTLYLHGICCDIDVETGPRQLPSHLLRRRLRLLKQLYPPPSGYAVLPEDLR